MRFGGWTRFGGSARFGGAESRSREYYRILKDMRPPGVYDDSDDALASLLLRGDGKILGDHGQILAEAIYQNIFPQTAEEKLTEWESALQVVPPSGATIKSRQEAVTARWRGGVLSSNPDLRAILDTLLNSQIAFRDTFDDASLLSHARAWTITDHNGTTTEPDGSSCRQLEIILNDTCIWTTALNFAPLNLIKLVDRNDNYSICARVFYYSFADGLSGDGETGGIMLYLDDTHAIQFGVRKVDSDYTLSLSAMEDSFSENIATIAVPPIQFWLKLRREGNKYTASYSTDILHTGSYTAVGTHTSDRFNARHAGLFLRNTINYQDAVIAFNDFIVEYDTPKNNVEIIEPAPEDTVGDNRFFAFVHRDPMSINNYNLIEAQRAMDRAKQAHTLITVGESDCFLCDDHYSLCDRDVLGV